MVITAVTYHPIPRTISF